MQFSSALPFWAPECQIWFFTSFCQGNKFLSLLRSPALCDFPLLTESKSTAPDETEVSLLLGWTGWKSQAKEFAEKCNSVKANKEFEDRCQNHRIIGVFLFTGTLPHLQRAKGTEVRPKARMWQPILKGKKTPKICCWGVEELPAKTRSDQLFSWEGGKLGWEENSLEADLCHWFRSWQWFSYQVYQTASKHPQYSLGVVFISFWFFDFVPSRVVCLDYFGFFFFIFSNFFNSV